MRAADRRRRRRTLAGWDHRQLRHYPLRADRIQAGHPRWRRRDDAQAPRAALPDPSEAAPSRLPRALAQDGGGGDAGGPCGREHRAPGDRRREAGASTRRPGACLVRRGVSRRGGPWRQPLTRSAFSRSPLAPPQVRAQASIAGRVNGFFLSALAVARIVLHAGERELSALVDCTWRAPTCLRRCCITRASGGCGDSPA